MILAGYSSSCPTSAPNWLTRLTVRIVWVQTFPLKDHHTKNYIGSIYPPATGCAGVLEGSPIEEKLRWKPKAGGGIF